MSKKDKLIKDAIVIDDMPALLNSAYRLCLQEHVPSDKYEIVCGEIKEFREKYIAAMNQATGSRGFINSRGKVAKAVNLYIIYLAEMIGSKFNIMISYDKVDKNSKLFKGVVIYIPVNNLGDNDYTAIKNITTDVIAERYKNAGTMGHNHSERVK